MAKKILTEAAVAAIAAGASEAEVEHLMEDASEVVAETEETEVDASETVSEEAETEEHTDIEASASEDDDPVAEPANDTSLVSYLKGEVARLSEENAKLVSLSDKAKSALASESALKCIVNEAIARMSVPLGITHMNLSSMESSVLIEQYENVKTQFASKFKVSGMAAVKDEDESASVDDDLSPVEEARLRANKL